MSQPKTRTPRKPLKLQDQGGMNLDIYNEFLSIRPELRFGHYKLSFTQVAEIRNYMSDWLNTVRPILNMEACDDGKVK